MARTRIVQIKPSLGGVYRVSGFQSTEPYTAANATNMWSVDAKTSRQRIATRPRHATYSASVTNASGPPASFLIRGIGEVNSTTNQTYVRGLFVFADGKIWRLTGAGTFTSVSSGPYSTSRYICSVPYLQKLYYTGDTGLSSFNCVDNTVNDSPSATAGTIPTDCTIVAEWSGRLVLSGDTATPHGVYMSRVGDPLDWDYDETDAGAAVDLTVLDGGNIGERITAIISHNRECLIVGATDSMHIMRGNPRDGGRMEIISHTVGPLSQTAWCKTSDDNTLIMTRNGLYIMPAGCGAAPQPFSAKRIPDSFKGIDTSTYEVHMAFDTRFHGVHIYLTGAASAEAWWLDWETGAFWPMELESGQKPWSLLRFDPLDGNDVSGVLVGGNDGTVRRFDRTSTATMTTVNYYTNPIKLSSSPLTMGMIQKMQCVFGSNTTDTTGTIAIYCAKNGEAAYAAAVADTAHKKFAITIANQNNNHVSYPRVGDHAAVIKFTQGSTSTFTSLEEITLQILEGGANR